MKKLFVILLAVAMILTLAVLASCDNGEEESTTANEAATTVTAATTEAEKATTVADAEVATTVEDAAEETTAEEITEAETQADGRREDEEQFNLYDGTDGSKHSPVKISKKSKGTGFIATIPEGKWVNGVSFCCPSYSDDFGSLTIYIYRFDTDMKTTLAGTEIYKETFEDFTDNEWLEVYFLDSQIAHSITNGDYVFVLKEGIDEVGEGVGVWTDVKWDEESMEPALDYNVRYIDLGKIQEKSNIMVDATLTIGFYSD